MKTCCNHQISAFMENDDRDRAGRSGGVLWYGRVLEELRCGTRIVADAGPSAPRCYGYGPPHSVEEEALQPIEAATIDEVSLA